MTDPSPDTRPGSTSASGSGSASASGSGSGSGSSEAGTRRDGGSGQAPRSGSGLLAMVRETVVVVVIALALSLLVKTFLLQAFFIPSQSMEDTLLIGDRVIVSKLTPGPFDLQRGEVIVFTDPGGWLGPAEVAPMSTGPVREALTFIGLLPNDSNNHLIKRIIGMPGDHVAYSSDVGKITVNGRPIDETYVRPGSTPSEREFDITVPRGAVWVMGDNRQESEDSRYHDDGTGRTGSVPIDDVTGRAVAVVWPVSSWSALSRPESVFAKVPAPSAKVSTSSAKVPAPSAK